MKVKDYISGEEFTITPCEYGAVTEVSKDVDIDKYYPVNYSRFCRPVEYLVRLFVKSRARFIERFCKHGMILDIGCGRGDLVRELVHHRYRDCYGTERHDPDIRRFQNMAAISLWHVFEHLRYPSTELSEIHLSLRRQGVLIIEVPNYSSWQARLTGKHWLYLEPPRHLHHYDLESLRYLLIRHRFTPIDVSTRSWQFGPIGMIQSLLNWTTERQNVLYQLMSGKNPFPDIWKDKYSQSDFVTTCALIVPIVIIGTALEWISWIFGHGAVIRIVARKQ